MKDFRFGIMGAGNIAGKFAKAIKLTKNATLASVSSKSEDRAKKFAKEYGADTYYSDYSKMLAEEQLDAVYIATTHNFHYELIKMCLEKNMPVICEKPMTINYSQAKEVIDMAKEKKVFLMEAMWSRFLPTVNKAKSIIDKGVIGDVVLMNFDIGFKAPYDPENRYYNPKLAGGAAYDITVYGYEMLTYFIKQKIEDIDMQVLYADTGVDHTNSITIKFENCIGNINTTIMIPTFEEKLIIYGSKGKIVMPQPHFGPELILYDENNKVTEKMKDDSENGFVYQINEVVECVKNNKLESDIATHNMTLECAKLFDRILDNK